MRIAILLSAHAKAHTKCTCKKSGQPREQPDVVDAVETAATELFCEVFSARSLLTQSHAGSGLLRKLARLMFHFLRQVVA